MTYEVQSKIPYASITKYPFREMRIGDSFEFPLAGEMATSSRVDKEVQLVACAAANYGRRHNCKFSVRTFREEGVGRIWRVK